MTTTHSDREENFDWYGDTPVVFQNPRAPLPAPSTAGLLRGVLLFPTSGSSGQPKWVAHTRVSLLAAAAGANRHLAATATDVWLRALPFFHVGGCAIGARATLSGSQVIDFCQAWDAVAFCALADTSEATLTSLVPTQVHDLVALRQHAPAQLRGVIVGGGALTPELYFAARQLGWPLLPSYGLTEAGSQVATASLASLNTENAQAWPALHVLDHWDARVMDAQLELRGPALFHGYYQPEQPGQFEKWSLINPFQHDWFRCADRVKLTESRELHWLGRSDRVVKILGELVNLDALETNLQRLHGHAECFLITLPDARTGLQLHVVSTRPLAAAWEAYHEDCAPFERLTSHHLMQEIPRSPLGKPLRPEMQKLVIARQKS